MTIISKLKFILTLLIIILFFIVFYHFSLLKKSTEFRYKGKQSKAVIAVKNYYTAINKMDCRRAITIRPAYKIEACKEIKKINLRSISLVKHGKKTAVVFIEVEIERKKIDTMEKVQGHFLLRKENKDWLIEEPFRVVSPKWTKEEFLNHYFKEVEVEPDWLEIDSTTHVTTTNGKNIDNETDQIEIGDPIQYVDLLTYNTFGSETVLASWTKDQLWGNPIKDKKVQRPIAANHSPPFYKIPRHQGIRLPSSYENSIRYVNTDRKIIALTFDLCERAKEKTGYDGAIVNYLRKNNVKATFYAGGKWMRSHAEKTQQLMSDPLFEIGNHGWTHGNMRVLRGKKMREQILWTQSQYEILRNDLQQRFQIPEDEMEKIPPVPLNFRFPYGTCNQESLKTLAEFGLPAVQWNIVTGDPAKGQTGKAIARTIMRQVKPGSIIIAHANGRGHGTEDSLHRFIPQLRAKGYEFVTVSELLALSLEVKTTKTCYEVKPGDNKRYDRIFGNGTE